MPPAYTVNWPRTQTSWLRPEIVVQKKVQVEQTSNLPDFHGLPKGISSIELNEHPVSWLRATFWRCAENLQARAGLEKEGLMRAELLAFGGVEMVKKKKKNLCLSTNLLYPSHGLCFLLLSLNLVRVTIYQLKVSWDIHFKWVKFMACKLYINKIV